MHAMIERREADQIISKSLELMSRLDESIHRMMMTGPSGRQFNEFRRAAGEVYGCLLTEILSPLVRAYPDLRPAGWEESDQTISPPEKPIDRALAHDTLALSDDVADFLSTLSDSQGAAFSTAIDDITAGLERLRSFITKSSPDVPDRA